ncbi:MAG: alpha/beta hydrolase [Crocinitomicaceae bacterium]
MQAILSHTVIHYERIGEGDDQLPVLLFLHEALGSISQWKSFPEQLCSQLKLPGIIYERQGHGLSAPLNQPRDEEYLHNYALKELPEFLDVINEKRALWLIGHSDGGTIALLFASAFPNRVQGIVTMAAHVINEPETIEGIAPAIEAYQAGKLKGLQKYHGDKTEVLFFAWANIWRSQAFKDWDITTEISNCKKPALFIQGTDDQYGTEKQLQLITSNYTGESTALMLPNCGHHPHLEQTEMVMAAITDLISSSFRTMFVKTKDFPGLFL